MSDIYSKVNLCSYHLSRTILGSSLKTSGKKCHPTTPRDMKKKETCAFTSSSPVRMYTMPTTNASVHRVFFFPACHETDRDIKGYSSSPRIRSNSGGIYQEEHPPKKKLQKKIHRPCTLMMAPSLSCFPRGSIFDWKKIWFKMPTASSVGWDEAIEFLYVLDRFGHRFGEVVIKTQWSW